jgi:hypothetical protein
MSSKANDETPGIQEIKENYETLIEGVRESVQQIAARIRPLTDEIDLIVPEENEQTLES